MADEALVGFGGASGVPVAVDIVGGAAYQRVKLDLGADNTVVPIVSTDGTVPVSGTVTANIAGAIPVTVDSVNVLPVELQVAMTGLMGGKAAKIIQVLGRRTSFNSTSVFQDACQFLVNGQNAYTEPAVGTTYYAVSTSNNDKAGSAGISKIRLVTLDSNNDWTVTSVTLNGTTPVSIGSGHKYFELMEASEMGTGGLVAAGDITISSVNGVATEATTMLMIKAGGNRSMDCKFKIPRAYTGYLVDWSVDGIGQTMDCRLRAEAFSDDRTLSAGIYHFQDTAFLAAGGNAHRPLNYLKIPALADVKVSVYPGATTGSPRLDATVTLMIVAD